MNELMLKDTVETLREINQSINQSINQFDIDIDIDIIDVES
jgi:predicted transglutaminase-like cysteine proteinase